jgi:hypothetical protein
MLNDSNSRQGYACAILLRCLQGTSRGVFIGSQGRSSSESWAGGGAAEGPAGQVLGVNRSRCFRFFLVAIWRDIPTEDLTRLAAKWG